MSDAPRPYRTWDRKALLDAYSTETDKNARRAIMAELDTRKREAAAPPKRKPFKPGWSGTDWATRAAAEHKQEP